MNLRLIRKAGTKGYTHGELFIDGVYFCETLEDEERNVKIAGITAIPDGIYRIILNKSPRFKRVLPRLINVPNFSGVLMHPGNDADDTEGCILVGRKSEKDNFISNSKVTFNALFKVLSDAVQKDQEIWIEIS